MITTKEYLLVVPDPIGQCCDECSARSKIYFVSEELHIKMLFGYTESTTFYGGFKFKNMKLLLNNELFFDTDKQQDPGFECCQYSEDIIKDSDVITKHYFISNTHIETPPYYSSWFYNDKDGNIIFEISPSYPWEQTRDEERAADSNFIPYAQWIKDYKVVVHRIIPKETLIQWNEQAKNYTHVFQHCDYDERQKEI